MGKNRNIISYYAPDDVVDLLELQTNRSEFITLALRTFHGSPIKHTETITGHVVTPGLPKKKSSPSPLKKWHPSTDTAWKYYLDKTGHTRTFTEQRKSKLNARLKELGPETLKRAMDYLLNSPFHNGDNDRKWKWDIDFLIRSTEQVEKFASLYEEPVKKMSLEDKFNAQ